MPENDSITISIRNFEKFRYRKDVANPSWFRCSNRLLEDQDFWEFSAEERLVWYRILELVSQKASATVTINFSHTKRICNISRKSIISAIEKLKDKQIVIGARNVDVTDAVRARNVDVTEAGATDRQTDRQTDIAAPVKKPDARKPVKFLNLEELKAAIDPGKFAIWQKLYPDRGYIDRELLKAFEYYARDNPRKTPTTIGGWQKALSSWFERGWSRFQTTIKGNRPADPRERKAIKYPSAQEVFDEQATARSERLNEVLELNGGKLHPAVRAALRNVKTPDSQRVMTKSLVDDDMDK